MKTFKTQVSSQLNTDLLPLIAYHKRFHAGTNNNNNNNDRSHDRILYLDIETTGFNRASDIVYLLGLLSVDSDHTIVLEQFLCQNSSDEYELLYSLNQRLMDSDPSKNFLKPTIISLRRLKKLPFIIEQKRCQVLNSFRSFALI